MMHKTGLAARLKRLRLERGLSLAQLSRATGISSSFLSLVEQAQSDITVGRLIRLAEFYDVELVDLLSGPPTAPGEHVHILRATTEHMMHSAAILSVSVQHPREHKRGVMRLVPARLLVASPRLP